MQEIETKYKTDRFSYRIRAHEFVAPAYLKDEINKYLNDVLSNMKTTQFKTNELLQAIAESEIERLKSIARQNQCHMDSYELETNISNVLTVPKATSSNTADKISSKVLHEQSDLLFSSPDVVRKLVLTNGFISVYSGDIAREKVSPIVA